MDHKGAILCRPMAAFFVMTALILFSKKDHKRGGPKVSKGRTENLPAGLRPMSAPLCGVPRCASQPLHHVRVHYAKTVLFFVYNCIDFHYVYLYNLHGKEQGVCYAHDWAV